MSDFLVAYFHTQLEAVSSAKKLLDCGIQRDRVALHVAENEDQYDSANDAGHKPSTPEAEEPAEYGALAGGITLSVTLKDPLLINEVCSVLKETGAYLIDVTEHNVTQEYPDM